MTANAPFLTARYPNRSIGPVTMAAIQVNLAQDLVIEEVEKKTSHVFAFCNVHTLNSARRLPALATALGHATVFNDGVGMDVASKILFGSAFPQNLNGTDLTPAVLAALPPGTNIFLLGGRAGVAERASSLLAQAFPHLDFVGSRDGYFEAARGGAVADAIRDSGADLVLVGMGNPQQELWASEYATRCGAVVLCVGAYLDFASGRVPRAPKIVRDVRCEWLYRLVREPRRMAGRYLGGVLPFLTLVLVEKLANSYRKRWGRKQSPAEPRLRSVGASSHLDR